MPHGATRRPPAVFQPRGGPSTPTSGIVEPLVVARRQEDTGPYMLVDGHLRYAALVDLGHSEAPCLIAGDDEAFTSSFI